MALQQHKDGSLMGHKWERAQLGVAPFRCIGMIERAISFPDGGSQAAGTCDYCGTGIRYCYQILSADGKRFEVGCDCVTYLNDDKLVAVVKSEERKRKNAIAAERRQVQRERQRQADEAEVDANLSEYRNALVTLAALPHPYDYFAKQGKTRADWYRYNEANGRPSVYQMRAAISEAQDVPGHVPASERPAPVEVVPVQVNHAEQNAWLIEVLDQQSGDFVRSMADQLRTRSISDLTKRQIEILADIYGKQFGRRNSKAYEQASDQFWTRSGYCGECGQNPCQCIGF